MSFISQMIKCDCSRGKKGTLVDRFGYHLNCCAKGSEWMQRHNGIQMELKTLALAAGCQVISNPKNCFPLRASDFDGCGVGKIPDLLLRDISGSSNVNGDAFFSRRTYYWMYV
jgi:hypothetical protein